MQAPVLQENRLVCPVKGCDWKWALRTPTTRQEGEIELGYKAFRLHWTNDHTMLIQNRELTIARVALYLQLVRDAVRDVPDEQLAALAVEIVDLVESDK